MRIEYRPELEKAITLKDMGFKESRLFDLVSQNIANKSTSKKYPGHTLLELPKYKQWIKKTVVLRTKNFGEKIFWLDEEDKVVTYCMSETSPLVGDYIREYILPHEKDPEKAAELRRECPAPYPMIGEIVLIRTSPMTIKEKRQEIGMSRAGLSRVLEIPIRTLEDWESGKRTPPAWAEKLIIEKLESMKENGNEN